MFKELPIRGLLQLTPHQNKREKKRKPTPCKKKKAEKKSTVEAIAAETLFLIGRHSMVHDIPTKGIKLHPLFEETLTVLAANNRPCF